VAKHYADFLNGFVLDERDAHLEPHVAALGIGVLTTDTLMHDADSRARLACEVIGFADRLRPERLGGCRLGQTANEQASTSQRPANLDHLPKL